MTDRSSMIDAAATKVFSNNVEGWVGHRIPHMIMFADSYHEKHGVRGDIMEIGVHHGALFFMMAAAAREDERCIAVDLFGDQDLNVDHSGKGDFDVFSRNMNVHFPEVSEKAHVVSADSMSLTSARAQRILQTNGVRLFSVDGGHTRSHVLNDLDLAQELIVSSGFVLLDDFFGPHWPGVTEGLYEFMSTRNKRLAPLAVFENKLFLTTFSEHDAMLSALRVFIEASYGDEIHQRWRYASVCGFQVLSFA